MLFHQGLRGAKPSFPAFPLGCTYDPVSTSYILPAVNPSDTGPIWTLVRTPLSGISIKPTLIY